MPIYRQLSGHCGTRVLPCMAHWLHPTLVLQAGARAGPAGEALLREMQATQSALEALPPEAVAEGRLRVERAKALRRCANLACPHLAADPQLRSKRCAQCRTVRYVSDATAALSMPGTPAEFGSWDGWRPGAIKLAFSPPALQCCAECQAQDWREGGHRAACSRLRAAAGGAEPRE